MSSSHNSSIWSSFKTKGKSLQSSFHQLNIKPSSEKDGDSPESTLVHKALVKYYKRREPFEGFPDWLGHKEEVNVQDQLQKHHPHSAEAAHATPEEAESGFSHGDSTTSTSTSKPLSTMRRKLHLGGPKQQLSAAEQQRLARPTFQGMFDQNYSETSSSSGTSTTEVLFHQQENYQQQQQQQPHSAPIAEQPTVNRMPSTSQLMRDRMKRRG
ncbi:hypothetical protein ACO0QE_000852 [Hanseniaspora vineae]